MQLIKPLNDVLLILAGTLVVIVCLHIDINILHDDLSELSLTEIMQEFILFVIVVSFLRLAYKFSFMRSLHIIIASFFLIMLIRELDALFDYILFHGGWVYFALLILVLSSFFALKHHVSIAHGFYVYYKGKHWGIMLCGLLTILVFSRLFGQGYLWNNVLGDGYLRLVKNIVEETSELFGYMLCFVSTLGYQFDFRGNEFKNKLGYIEMQGNQQKIRC